jgi:hypothetical protein
MARGLALSFAGIMTVALASATQSWGESAFQKGRQEAIGAVYVNTLVFCLIAEKWIPEDDRETQTEKWMDYYQQKYKVSDKTMAEFASHPNYYGAIESTIKNLGGCQKLLDNQWGVK